MLLENWYFNNRDIGGYIEKKSIHNGDFGGKMLDMFWDKKKPRVTRVLMRTSTKE